MTRGSSPVPLALAVRAAGRLKAATEIMSLPWRAAGGDFPRANTPCTWGRGRGELAGLMLGGSSGGVRKDELLRLVREGKDDCPSTLLGGESCACCIGEEAVDAPSGDGELFVGEGRSEEVRRTGDDPDARFRARAIGDGAGETELVRGEVCTTGGVVGIAVAKG